uniref:Uncharacterized protein n=1 Tax=Anguilla anguilla TaxID=7936 RepID=A0A0E9QUC4_ANGAN
MYMSYCKESLFEKYPKIPAIYLIYF